MVIEHDTAHDIVDEAISPYLRNDSGRRLSIWYHLTGIGQRIVHRPHLGLVSSAIVYLTTQATNRDQVKLDTLSWIARVLMSH